MFGSLACKSYSRGEATETSDIDVVVILDKLSAKDIETYNRMLNTFSHRDLICSFLSGKDELLNWEASDLFQFYDEVASSHRNKKRTPHPDGFGVLLELLARFELATVLPQSKLCGSP